MVSSYGAGPSAELPSGPQSWMRKLQAAALALLLLGLASGVGSAQVATATKPRDHVYLLRGAFNVFSLGLDDIADKLRSQGINVTIHNYLVWSTLADEATADYKSGRVQTIVLVGHSSSPMDTVSRSRGDRNSLACCKISMWRRCLISGISTSRRITNCSRR